MSKKKPLLSLFEEFLERYSRVILISILLTGLLVRLYGINFGLPYRYNPDEQSCVSRVLRMLANRDLNPHWFGHPGTTIMYMLAGLYGILFIIGRCLGIFTGAEDFEALYFRDATIFFLSGRLLCAVFGIATVWLVYLIGRRIFNKTTGLLAASIIAISPLHVYYSKLIRSDILMSFIILGAFWFSLNILKSRSFINYIIVGFLTGLAIATKYPAVIFMLTLIQAQLVTKRWQARDNFTLLISSIACLLGAFVGSPFLFIDLPQVISDLIREARPTHLSATGEGLINNIIWYCQNPLRDSFTVYGLLFVFIGIVLCLGSKQKSGWLLISFPVFFLVFISCLSLRWDRWIIPIIPFSCILLAHAIHQFVKWSVPRLNFKIGFWIGIISFGIIFSILLHMSIIQGREMSGLDTRTLARQWIINNIPPKTSVLVEEYTPQIPTRLFRLFEVHNNVIREVEPDQIKSEIFISISRGIGMIDNVEAIHSRNIKYMIMSDLYDRYKREENRYLKIVKNYEKLMNYGTLVYEKQSLPTVNKGPKIRIYKFN